MADFAITGGQARAAFAAVSCPEEGFERGVP